MQRMSFWQIALRRVEIPVGQFLLFYVGGSAIAGLLLAIILIFFTGGLADGVIKFITFLYQTLF